MKVPVPQFSAAVSQYLMQHIIPAIKNPVDRFSAGLASGKISASLPGMIERLGPPYVEGGLVCTDAIEASLKNGFSVLDGGKLPIPLPSTGKIISGLFGAENKPLTDSLLAAFGMSQEGEGALVFTEGDWAAFKSMLS